MHNPEHLRPDSPNQPVILVAEDDVMVLNIVRITLEKDGYFVLTAENGEEALYLSRQFPGEIHLLLTDIQMPKLGGVELCRALLTQRPETCVVLMSGSPELADPRFHLIHKPFGPVQLSQTIKGLLPVCAHITSGVAERPLSGRRLVK